MTEGELERRAQRRLGVLRHVEEVSGNVAATCRYYGISRQCYYGWLRRFEADGLDGLKDRSQRPHHSPTSSPKSAAGQRILELPTWAADMLRRRYASRVGDQVFPAPRSGTVRDRSNTGRCLRSAFARAAFAGLSSHAIRKSVATLMSEAGLSSRDAADQLGHSRPSITTDVYFGRNKRARGAAAVLEDLFDS